MERSEWCLEYFLSHIDGLCFPQLFARVDCKFFVKYFDKPLVYCVLERLLLDLIVSYILVDSVNEVKYAR